MDYFQTQNSFFPTHLSSLTVASFLLPVFRLIGEDEPNTTLIDSKLITFWKNDIRDYPDCFQYKCLPIGSNYSFISNRDYYEKSHLKTFEEIQMIPIITIAQFVLHNIILRPSLRLFGCLRRRSEDLFRWTVLPAVAVIQFFCFKLPMGCCSTFWSFVLKVLCLPIVFCKYCARKCSSKDHQGLPGIDVEVGDPPKFSDGGDKKVSESRRRDRVSPFDDVVRIETTTDESKHKNDDQTENIRSTNKKLDSKIAHPSLKPAADSFDKEVESIRNSIQEIPKQKVSDHPVVKKNFQREIEEYQKRLAPTDEGLKQKEERIEKNAEQEESPNDEKQMNHDANIGQPPWKSIETSSENELESVQNPIQEVQKQQVSDHPAENTDFQIEIEEYQKRFEPTDENLKRNEEWNEKNAQQEEKLGEMSRISEELNHGYESSGDEEYRKQKEQLEAEFQEKMAEQNSAHQERMESEKLKREQRQKEYVEELKQIKLEMQQRSAALIACIQLKLRFEEKEQEWSDFLNKLRTPLISIKTDFFKLENEFHRVTQDQTDEIEIIENLKFFGKKVAKEQNMMCQAFYFLENYSKSYEEKIFLKMIMKDIRNVVQKCNAIGSTISCVLKSPSESNLQSELSERVAQLNPHEISSTSRLKTNSTAVNLEDFVNMEEPPYADWYTSLD